MLAPGEASRCILLCLRRQATPRADIATSCPCEASRANNFLAGRSLAASVCHTCQYFVATPERDQREPERSDGSSRARSEATRFPLATCGTRPVSSGLVRFDDFEMQWNGGGIFAAAMERNGEAANWRVRPGRGRKRADTWCKARRTSGGSVTSGLKSFLLTGRFSENHLSIRKLFFNQANASDSERSPPRAAQL